MAVPRVNTIADIARIAGVSKSTVSRALNDSPLIGVETRERIQAIAREHRFEMNAPARQLRLRRSRSVAIVAQALKTGESALPDVFMLEIMSGISAGLAAVGYDLLVIHSMRDDAAWAKRYFETGRVAGLILMSSTCSPRQLDEVLAVGVPFIMWGDRPSDHAYSSVSGDSFTGGRVATEHLLRAGRRRIAFLGGPAQAVEVRQRRRGYEAALGEADIAPDPALVTHVFWHPPEVNGPAAIRELLERAPDLDAVFVNSDMLAIAAMDTLREAGRTVPDDVAVVGYDDISVARYSNPPLTTVRQNGPLAGRLLAKHLVEHVESGVITNVSIPAELVVRGSA
jgi:DNA-binding LacI/PurR family transcriptional regulator